MRHRKGHLIIFEATGDLGVSLTDWKDFIENKWDELYDKIVYRKMYFERTNERLEALESFIKVNNGN